MVFNRCHNQIKLISLFVVPTVLSGCFHDTESENAVIRHHNAVVATAASDYSSGTHSVIAIDDDGYTATNELDGSGSDLKIVTYGEYIYRIGRFGMNNITKYSIHEPGTSIWQYTTQDTGSQISSNPYDIAFVSETKAYVIRYGTDKIWVVNPTATSQNEFKTGEIDLSAYADADGTPEMSQAMIVGDKLFVLMQRLEYFSPAEAVNPYIAVFDTTTNVEIDTTESAADLKGISLSIKNPGKMNYLSSNNTLYVSAVGKYENIWVDPHLPAEYTGGILSVDLNNYDTSLILDDGDADNHPYGQINNIAILNSSRGYFHSYTDGFSDAIYQFNPTTGEVDTTPILADTQISDMVIGPLGNLWVANGTLHGITIINTVDNSTIGNTIDTVLNPINIAFITVEETMDEEE